MARASLRWLTLCWLGIAFFSITSTTIAQTSSAALDAESDTPVVLPTLMSLEQSLRLANTRHPRVLEQLAQLQAGQAELQRAGLDNRWQAHLELTARTAELQVFDRGFENDSRTKLKISNLLWDFGRSSNQNESANLGIDSAELGLRYAQRLQRIEIMHSCLPNSRARDD